MVLKLFNIVFKSIQKYDVFYLFIMEQYIIKIGSIICFSLS